MGNNRTHEIAKGETDEALVVAAQGGCGRAFETLVNRYFGLIYTLAFARLREHEAAEDLAQEVFVRLYLGLPSLREPKFFATWASRVARNLASDWSRNRQRASRLITLIPLEDSGVEQNPANAPDARERLLESEQMSELRAAILQLPIEQREILLLHYQRGMTQQEIGARLEMHHTTVGRHLERALEKLRGWSNDLDALARAPRRSFASAGERRAVARTIALVAATVALDTEARSTLAAAATDGMSRLGAATANHTAAPIAASPMTATGATAHTAAVAMKGTLMAGKTKAGLVALAAMTALGATYHTTHPGELQQLLRGTTPSNVKVAGPEKPAHTFFTPTLGPGEEVYVGRLGPLVEELVVRIKPVPGGMPQAQFDVPKALIMEYPMKTLSSQGDKLELEATGQFGLSVTHSSERLIGEAKLHMRRKDIPSTCTVDLKRVSQSIPIGRDFPAPLASPLQAQQLDRFVGEYVASSSMSLTITRQGDQLFAQTSGQDPLPIYPMSDNRFYYRAITGEVSFWPGSDGKIVRMVLHQQRDTPGRKVS